jgi:hypothetical protein
VDNEKRKIKLKEALAKQDLFKVEDVQEVNHKPHPYMIGPRHIKASQQYGGILSLEVISKCEETNECSCAHKGCGVRYEDHTSDRVVFLQHLRNGTFVEANDTFVAIQELLLSLNIDGIVMVETEEEYRCK